MTVETFSHGMYFQSSSSQSMSMSLVISAARIFFTEMKMRKFRACSAFINVLDTIMSTRVHHLVSGFTAKSFPEGTDPPDSQVGFVENACPCFWDTVHSRWLRNSAGPPLTSCCGWRVLKSLGNWSCTRVSSSPQTPRLPTVELIATSWSYLSERFWSLRVSWLAPAQLSCVERQRSVVSLLCIQKCCRYLGNRYSWIRVEQFILASRLFSYW